MTAATTLPPTARLVHRLAARFDPERSSPRRPDLEGRRGFLVRAALVGTALAAGPLRFVLRPGSAYASVCGDGVGCGTGWTVFCCTVNDGANTCPEGTFAAGWWKADGSNFCGGAARYYIDCNRLPSQPGACSCTCHSGNGTCDQRRYCCNVFRYGQCHLEIAGVTPVVCRVILCTPPWQWDPACSASPRTDNRTGQHTAPCLPGPGASAITVKYQDLGMTGSALGQQVSAEEGAPGGGARVRFENGDILWRADLGAWGSWGPIHEAWTTDHGGPGGYVGYPRSDTGAVAGDGQQQHFERASLFWSEATDAQPVYGAILIAYLAAGGPSALGYPLAPEEPAPQGGRRSRFERGVVHWRADLGAHATAGAIFDRWSSLGGAEGFVGLPWTDELPAGGGRGRVQWFTGAAIWSSVTGGAREVHEPVLARYIRAGAADGGIGFPTSDTQQVAGGVVSSFERGTITSRPDVGTRAVYGAIHERWVAIGGPESAGFPWTDAMAVGDRRGQVQWFEGRAIFWSPQTGAWDVAEPILAGYAERGGPAGPLGYPVAGTEDLGGGRTRCRFERGVLVADGAGTVTQG